MRRFNNDVELQMPSQSLSSESQCSTDSFLSCWNVASRRPISTHSFDWQPTKETTVTVEETMTKSQEFTIWLLNSIYDFVYIASIIIVIKNTMNNAEIFNKVIVNHCFIILLNKAEVFNRYIIVLLFFFILYFAKPNNEDQLRVSPGL
jgi:hypothetical protein